MLLETKTLAAAQSPQIVIAEKVETPKDRISKPWIDPKSPK